MKSKTKYVSGLEYNCLKFENWDKGITSSEILLLIAVRGRSGERWGRMEARTLTANVRQNMIIYNLFF